MLRPRSFIIAIFVIAGMSILWTVFKLGQPPDSNGWGHDSYGTRYTGYKALYDILHELDVPADRGLSPPINFTLPGTTIVFLDPDPLTVQLEPGYLNAVSKWVHEGGHVIVATGEYFDEVEVPDWIENKRKINVLQALGLENIRIHTLDNETTLRGKGEVVIQNNRDNPLGIARVSTHTKEMIVETTGEWEFLNDKIEWLETPADNFLVISTHPEPEPHAASAYVLGPNNEKFTIAAKYKKGEGTITIISDSRLLKNYTVYQKDNPVLAAHIFAGTGGKLLFDEFYHNLTVRGNPAWLLSRHPFGLLTILLLIACGIWIARASNRLGPSLPIAQANRRSIGEYIDAVGNLFERGRAHHFILAELREGIIWSIAKELRLAPRHRNDEMVIRVLERRDPARAERLKKALLETDVLIQQVHTLHRSTRRNAIVQTARKLTGCL